MPKLLEPGSELGTGADAAALIIGRERAVSEFIFPRERQALLLGGLGCFQ